MSSQFYLSVEGVDAVGKTTLVQKLRSDLIGRGVRAAIKSEFPASSNISNEIEQALQRSPFISEGFSSGPAAAFFFMLYAELAAIADTAETCDVLVSDRGPESACIYQGSSLHSRGSFDANKVVLAVENLYSSLGLRLPDCTLLLTLSPQELAHRLEMRNGRAPMPAELEYLLWLQDKFVEVAALRPRFVRLNAGGEVEEVLQEALEIVQAKINL
ncbi:hypothetical protein CEK29_08400 [Bordetella genomosp. 5]|uniref:dTMP kinase n=1 Tax=Bordetella genomosp. 5 TaxID=1395608 RepID=UPI000B9DFC6B|nr:deoxynucleoside kinase [Bordetella genomosp. 5]OZI44715.1 hypothetical protein CEK29_08400 [Bordetella genomosp. 5]